MADLGKEYLDIAEVALANNDIQAALYWMTKSSVMSLRALSWQIKIMNDRYSDLIERPIMPVAKGSGEWNE